MEPRYSWLLFHLPEIPCSATPSVGGWGVLALLVPLSLKPFVYSGIRAKPGYQQLVSPIASAFAGVSLSQSLLNLKEIIGDNCPATNSLISVHACDKHPLEQFGIDIEGRTRRG